jgi:hypothetical protein
MEHLILVHSISLISSCLHSRQYYNIKYYAKTELSKCLPSHFLSFAVIESKHELSSRDIQLERSHRITQSQRDVRLQSHLNRLNFPMVNHHLIFNMIFERLNQKTKVLFIIWVRIVPYSHTSCPVIQCMCSQCYLRSCFMNLSYWSWSCCLGASHIWNWSQGALYKWKWFLEAWILFVGGQVELKRLEISYHEWPYLKTFWSFTVNRWAFLKCSCRWLGCSLASTFH